MESRGYYKQCEHNNKEIFEKLNQSSRERLMDFNKKQWITEAFTASCLNACKSEFPGAESKITEEDWERLSAIMDKQMNKIISFMQEENWLQLELLLSYYYNARHDIET